MSDALPVTLYGIPNCDTVRKARAWLTANAIAHHFHDFKKSGLSRELVGQWVDQVGWESLVNRKGTTWRALSAESKAAVTDAGQAIRLMLESPSVVKRPVLVTGDATLVGFDEMLYSETLLPRVPMPQQTLSQLPVLQPAMSRPDTAHPLLSSLQTSVRKLPS